MPEVKIYRTAWCPFCQRAEALLDTKGIADLEIIDIEVQPGARDKMIELTGRTSVPQIFIGDRHIGGCDDLHELQNKGELDALLTG